MLQDGDKNKDKDKEDKEAEDQEDEKVCEHYAQTMHTPKPRSPAFAHTQHSALTLHLIRQPMHVHNRSPAIQPPPMAGRCLNSSVTSCAWMASAS